MRQQQLELRRVSGAAHCLPAAGSDAGGRPQGGPGTSSTLTLDRYYSLFINQTEHTLPPE